jgi:hypothetical protein
MKNYIFTFLALLTVCSCDSPQKTYDPDEVVMIKPYPPIQQLFNYTLIGSKAWTSKNYDYDIIIEGRSSAEPIPVLDVFKGKVGTRYTTISLEVMNVIEGDFTDREFVFGQTYTVQKDVCAERPSFIGEFRVWIKKMSVGYSIKHIEKLSNQSTHSITGSAGSE